MDYLKEPGHDFWKDIAVELLKNIFCPFENLKEAYSHIILERKLYIDSN